MVGYQSIKACRVARVSEDLIVLINCSNFRSRLTDVVCWGPLKAGDALNIDHTVRRGAFGGLHPACDIEEVDTSAQGTAQCRVLDDVQSDRR